MIIFGNPLLRDSISIPGCKYYITSNDSTSGLDSISQRCKNYYYFSNKSNTYEYNCARNFIITKVSASPSCSLNIGIFDSTDRSFSNPCCDSLSEKIHISINGNYFYDTIFFKWDFPKLIGKIRSAINDNRYLPGLKFSLHSNTDSAALYFAKPDILLSSIINTIQSKPRIASNRIGLISVFQKRQKPAFRVIYNIRGQMIPAIPEDGISIGLN